MLGKECHSIGSLGKAWFSILNGKLEVPLKLRERRAAFPGWLFLLFKAGLLCGPYWPRAHCVPGQSSAFRDLSASDNELGDPRCVCIQHSVSSSPFVSLYSPGHVDLLNYVGCLLCRPSWSQIHKLCLPPEWNSRCAALHWALFEN